MPTPILTRKQTPFDDVPAEVFAGLAAFLRRAAPRWVDGSRSLNRLNLRRAHQRERARGRRLGYRLARTPALPVSSGGVVRRRGR